MSTQSIVILLIGGDPPVDADIQTLLGESGAGMTVEAVTDVEEAAVGLAADRYAACIVDRRTVPDSALAVLCRACAAANLPVILLTDGPDARTEVTEPVAEIVPVDRIDHLLERTLRWTIENSRLRRTIAAIESTKERFRLMVEKAYDAFIILDARGKFIYSSPGIERILGVSPEFVIGRSVLGLVHPENLRSARAALAEVLEAPGEASGMILRVANVDGSWRWIEVSGANLLHDRHIGGVICTMHDITGRVLAEQEREDLLARIEEKRRRLNTIVETIPGMMWESRQLPDGQGQETTFMSRYVEKMLGYTPEEYMAVPDLWLQLVHADDLPKMNKAARDFDPTGEIQYQYRLIARDGRTVWVDVRLVILRDAHGEPVGTIGLAFDISDRKAAEDSLALSEQRYRSLVAASSQAVWVTNRDGDGISSFSTWGNLTGQNPAESEGLGWLDTVHPEDRERVETLWERAYAEARPFETEYRLRIASGEYRLVRDRGVPVIDERGSLREWVGTCHDITEQRQAEEALRHSEEYFRLLTENTLDVISILDADGSLRYTSSSIERVAGRSPGSRIGKGSSEFIHADDRERTDRAFADLVGRPGETIRVEYRYHHADGSVRVMESIARNLLDHPVVAGVVVSSRDITDRKRAEQELQEANDRLELRVMERTSEIVQMMRRLEEAYRHQRRFVADASHDLRTPLTALRAEIDLLLLDELDPTVRKALERIARHSWRLDTLTDDLLVLATLDGKQTLEMIDHVRLDEILLECVSQLSPLAAEKSIAWKIDMSDPIELTGDSSTLRRALTNLLENSVKYSSPDSVIDIGLTFDGAKATIVVTDHGVGIHPADLPRIFDRFFRGDRTRSTPGTGLGLSIVKAAVEAHGGDVAVESRPDQGTTFTITLPTG